MCGRIMKAFDLKPEPTTLCGAGQGAMGQVLLLQVGNLPYKLPHM